MHDFWDILKSGPLLDELAGELPGAAGALRQRLGNASGTHRFLKKLLDNIPISG